MMNELITSGLLGTGKYGAWSVEIEDICKGSQRVVGLILNHPMVSLQFTVPDTASIHDIVSSLSTVGSTPLKIDGCFGGSLNWIYDEGRLCVRQISRGSLGESQLFEIILLEDQRQELILAMKSALEDL